MKNILVCLLLVIGSSWAAKLPSIPGIRPGRDRFSLGKQLLTSYLPPTPTGPEECVHPTETTTLYLTSTSVVYEEKPGLGDRTVTITSTELVPSTIIRTSTSIYSQVQTIVSTIFFSTQSTRVITSTYIGGAETRTVTSTVTSVSTAYNYVTRTSTQFSTISTVVTSTQLSTQVVRTTYTQFSTQASTRFITQTQQGSTSLVTRTSTYREVVTQTSPPRTITSTTTSIATTYETKTERLPADISTLYSTVVSTKVSTIFSTYTQQETRFITSTQLSTQFSTVTSFATERVTSTITSSRVVTSTIRSTLVSTQVIPTTVTEGRASTTVVRLPASTIGDRVTVTKTTTVSGFGQQRTTEIVVTETSTNIVTRTVGGQGGIFTITATKTEPCQQQTGYSYNEPDQQLSIGS